MAGGHPKSPIRSKIRTLPSEVDQLFERRGMIRVAPSIDQPRVCNRADSGMGLASVVYGRRNRAFSRGW
jgi:hypothetical protein